jgi:hypothetical protein
VSRQADYLKNRRNAGKCGYGGCQAVTGDIMYCDRHRAAINVGRRRRVAERAAHKLALAIVKRANGVR